APVAMAGEDHHIAASQIQLVAKHGTGVLDDVPQWLEQAAASWKQTLRLHWNILAVLQLLLGLAIIYSASHPHLAYPAREKVEKLFNLSLRAASALAVAITLLILGM